MNATDGGIHECHWNQRTIIPKYIDTHPCSNVKSPICFFYKSWLCYLESSLYLKVIFLYYDDNERHASNHLTHSRQRAMIHIFPYYVENTRRASNHLPIAVNAVWYSGFSLYYFLIWMLVTFWCIKGMLFQSEKRDRHKFAYTRDQHLSGAYDFRALITQFIRTVIIC